MSSGAEKPRRSGRGAVTRNMAEDRSADLERRLFKAHAALEQITRECDGLNKGPVAVQIALEALESSRQDIKRPA